MIATDKKAQRNLSEEEEQVLARRFTKLRDAVRDTTQSIDIAHRGYQDSEDRRPEGADRIWREIHAFLWMYLAQRFSMFMNLICTSNFMRNTALSGDMIQKAKNFWEEVYMSMVDWSTASPVAATCKDKAMEFYFTKLIAYAPMETSA